MGDGDKTAQPTGRARGRARGRPRTAEELAAMRRPGETTTNPVTTAQGWDVCNPRQRMLVKLKFSVNLDL